MEIEQPQTSPEASRMTFKSWAASLSNLPHLAAERTFHVPSKEQLVANAEASGAMKRVLGVFDVIMVGIGIILGSGIYVVTGEVANTTAGPAVVLSYIVAGISAMLSGICYAEYAVDFPVAGGSYTYILGTFGELMAWLTVGMMIFQYFLANAGVARGFSAYFASLCNQSSDIFLIAGSIDFMAFGLILACTALLIVGTKESAWFNNACNIVAVVCVVFVIITGFVYANPANMDPFFGEFGWRGVFNGAAIVFFSYIGFDAICNTAEEVKNPKRDLPIGLIGSLSVVTALYVLASLAIVLMVPYTEISDSAAFAVAFTAVGAKWASFIVAAGACVGIVTGVLVGCMTVPRLVAAAAREGLLPSLFAKIHPRFKTPWVATLFTGSITALLALFTSLGVLLDLTSICVLTVYAIIGAGPSDQPAMFSSDLPYFTGVLWRRYFKAGVTTGKQTALLMAHFITIIASSILLGCAFTYETPFALEIVGIVVWFVATASMAFLCKPAYIPSGFSVPLMPWLASASVLCSLFLLCTVPAYAFVYYAIFVGILLAIYSLFGIHNASSREGGGFAAVASKEEFDEEEEGVTEDDDEMLPAGVVRSTTTTTTTARV